MELVESRIESVVLGTFCENLNQNKQLIFGYETGKGKSKDNAFLLHNIRGNPKSSSLNAYLGKITITFH